VKILAVTKSVPKNGTVVAQSRIGAMVDGTYKYGGPYVWWRDDKGRLRLAKGTVA
jgi:hypothetical protein